MDSVDVIPGELHTQGVRDCLYMGYGVHPNDGEDVSGLMEEICQGLVSFEISREKFDNERLDLR